MDAQFMVYSWGYDYKPQRTIREVIRAIHDLITLSHPETYAPDYDIPWGDYDGKWQQFIHAAMKEP